MDDRYLSGGGEEREEPSEERSNPRFKSDSEVEELNRALLPAALSATSYARSCWAFDVAAGVADPAAWMDEAHFAKDRGMLARALMVAKLCRPLTAEELGVKPGASGASFERGVWRKGDLGAALCCLAEGVDGVRELHVCVRGTEQENNPAPWLSSFQTVVGYFAWTYPRIEKHAKLFGPLAEAVQAYAANPANGVGRIVLSGHSLGASAAESLLPKLRSPGVEVSMFGFGSPGTGSGWVAPLLATGRATRSVGQWAGRLGLSAAAGSFSWIGRVTEGASSGGISGFSAMAKRAAARLAPKAQEPLAAHSEELVQFRHPNDPVPKMGGLIYSTAGAVRECLEPMEFMRREAGVPVEARGFAAHSMTRYASSVEMMLAQAREDVNPGAAAPKRLEQMTRARMEAIELERSVPAEEHNERVRAARERYIADLAQANKADPAIAWAESLPPVEGLASRIKVMRGVRKFHAAMVAQDRLGEPMILGPSSLVRSNKPKGG